jgi:hypothetical protein
MNISPVLVQTTRSKLGALVVVVIVVNHGCNRNEGG